MRRAASTSRPPGCRPRRPSLGARDTVVRNPSGLDAKGQVTSAYDLALVARAGMRLPAFRSLVATRHVDFPGKKAKRGKRRPTYQIQNHNRLLANYDGAIGVKNGYTEAARWTVVGAATRGGRTYVVTALRRTDGAWRPQAKPARLGVRPRPAGAAGRTARRPRRGGHDAGHALGHPRRHRHPRTGRRRLGTHDVGRPGRAHRRGGHGRRRGRRRRPVRPGPAQRPGPPPSPARRRPPPPLTPFRASARFPRVIPVPDAGKRVDARKQSGAGCRPCGSCRPRRAPRWTPRPTCSTHRRCPTRRPGSSPTRATTCCSRTTATSPSGSSAASRWSTPTRAPSLLVSEARGGRVAPPAGHRDGARRGDRAAGRRARLPRRVGGRRPRERRRARDVPPRGCRPQQLRDDPGLGPAPLTRARLSPHARPRRAG
nr:hypothetical protein [Angustibacter aerolatus]